MGGFDPERAALAVADALRAVGTAERAVQEKRYLKSELEFFGVTVLHTSEMSGVTFREAVRRLSAGEAGRLQKLRRPPSNLSGDRPSASKERFLLLSAQARGTEDSGYLNTLGCMQLSVIMLSRAGARTGMAALEILTS